MPDAGLVRAGAPAADEHHSYGAAPLRHDPPGHVVALSAVGGRAVSVEADDDQPFHAAASRTAVSQAARSRLRIVTRTLGQDRAVSTSTSASRKCRRIAWRTDSVGLATIWALSSPAAATSSPRIARPGSVAVSWS
jgi:hypothetical protein